MSIVAFGAWAFGVLAVLSFIYTWYLAVCFRRTVRTAYNPNEAEDIKNEILTAIRGRDSEMVELLREIRGAKSTYDIGVVNRAIRVGLQEITNKHRELN